MSTLKGLLSDPKDRRFVIVAVACAPLSILLGMVHPVFAFLAIAPAALIAYMLCGMISRIVFGKDFVFVSKFGLNTPEENLAIRWSDYALTLLCSLLAVLGMFLAGEIVDRMRGEDFWKWDLPEVHLPWSGKGGETGKGVGSLL